MTQVDCKRELLRTLPFFSGLPDSQIDAVLPHFQYRRYPSHFRILRAGAKIDGLYVLLSGRAIVLDEDADGHQFIAREIGPGELFGELGLMESGLSISSVQSQEPCEVFFLARGRALELLEHSAAAALGMLRTVLKRLHDAQAKMQALALMTVYERVAQVLLETSRVIEGERRVEVGTERIAAMVGASREMVSRVIGDMIKRHVVRRHRRKLIVLDEGALSRHGLRDGSRERVATRSLPADGVAQVFAA